MYPPGTLVRLGNREVAVIARRASGKMQPEVRCVVNADGSLANSMPVRDTTQPDQAIIEAVAHDKYRSVLTSINKVWRTSRPAPA